MSNKIQARCLNKKTSFTLIEMVIVLTLLLGMGSLITINYREALAKSRFESELRTFKTILRTLHETLDLGLDPRLTFLSGEEGTTLLFEEALGAFSQKRFDFSTFKSVIYHDQPPPFVIQFGSKGAYYPPFPLFINGIEIKAIESPYQKLPVDNYYPEHAKKKADLPPP